MMTKFNVGDKVISVTHAIVWDDIYTIKYISDKGTLVVIDTKDNEWFTSSDKFELYKPPTFSYFHPNCGLHDWEVVKVITRTKVIIKSTSGLEATVPIELVKHYLGDKYVG